MENPSEVEISSIGDLQHDGVWASSVMPEGEKFWGGQVGIGLSNLPKIGCPTVGQDRQKCKETSNLDVIVMNMDTA